LITLPKGGRAEPLHSSIEKNQTTGTRERVIGWGEGYKRRKRLKRHEGLPRKKKHRLTEVYRLAHFAKILTRLAIAITNPRRKNGRGGGGLAKNIESCLKRKAKKNAQCGLRTQIEESESIGTWGTELS